MPIQSPCAPNCAAKEPRPSMISIRPATPLRMNSTSYLRFCAGKEQAESMTRKVHMKLPAGGKVDILYFTDKQYENIVSYTGRTKQDSRKNPSQFEMF
ncbi:hypothetical protein TH8_10250 [Thalassospira profundimaris]|nr:hypothetical protein TH8_10250 [Thalassospira profundimaris]